MSNPLKHASVIFVATVTAALFLTACRSPIAIASSNASLRIALPGNGSATAGSRSLLSDHSEEIHGWRVYGIGAGDDFSLIAAEGSPVILVAGIATGEWTITAEGFDEGGVAILGASRTVTLAPGDNALSITLGWARGYLVSRFTMNDTTLADDFGRASATHGEEAIATIADGESTSIDGEDYVLMASSTPDVSGSYIDIVAAGGGLLDLGDAFTLTMWIRPTHEADSGAMKQVLVSTQAGATTDSQTIADGFTLSYNTPAAQGATNRDGKLYFETADGSSRYVFDSGSSSIDLDSSTWQHVAVSVDKVAGAAIMYLNGVAVGTGEGPAFLSGFSSALSLRLCGMPGGEYFFTGGLDDVRIYGGALSSAQVGAIYDSATLPLGPPFAVSGIEYRNYVAGTAGVLDQYDQIVVSFNREVDPTSINSALTKGGTVTLPLNAVSVAFTTSSITLAGSSLPSWNLGAFSVTGAAITDNGGGVACIQKAELDSSGKVLTITLHNAIKWAFANTSATEYIAFIPSASILDIDGNAIQSGSYRPSLGSTTF